MSIENTFCDSESLKKILTRGSRIYMGGIAGVGMYPLAVLLDSMGACVSGYDSGQNSRTEKLAKKKIKVKKHFSSLGMRKADAFIYSNALTPDCRAYKYAKQKNIPCISRADAIGVIAGDYTTSVGIAGMHGKSTTASLVTHILTECGKNPTALVGARTDLLDYGRIGGGEYFVFEACEYMRSFLAMSPRLAVALNLELEHTDCYTDISDVKEAFLSYLNSDRVGVCLINADDQNLVSLIPRIKSRVYTFSVRSHSSDFFARDIRLEGEGVSFDFTSQGDSLGRVKTSLIGEHNVQNATAALAVCALLGVDMSRAILSASAFGGTKRRAEYKFSIGNTRVIEDYAHHPTEIHATLSALRAHGYGKIACIFQPHTYSRVYSFCDEMAKALSLSDRVIVTEIYSAREKNLYGVSGKDITDRMGKRAEYVPSLADAAEKISDVLDGYDALVIMGAGDVFSATDILRSKLT